MRMIRNGFVSTAFLILAMNAAAAQLKMPAVFDKPVSTQIIPLPLDPSNPRAPKAKRSCCYYPNFIVKEVDLGEKGAEELAIVRISRSAKNPPCNMKNAGEIIIKGD
jgi:hypothetical protein